MRTLQGANVLITGATGMIGAHLTQALLSRRPNRVVCTYRSIDPQSFFWHQPELQRAVILEQADITNFQRMWELVTQHEIDTIFHLAAQPIVGTAYHNPLSTITTNVLGTTNILEAARLYPGTQRVIVASSDKAYGEAQTLPYLESHRLEGRHPYDASKSSTDLICMAYFATYQLPVVITRFGNVYGPGDTNFNRLIPGALKALIAGKSLRIRSDGSPVRQYVYVKDVAEGYLAIAEHIDSVRGEAFNFGSDVILSVKDTVAALEKALSVRIPCHYANEAKYEISRQYLNWDKAKNKLGWQPRHTFDDAVRVTYDWYQHILR